MRHRSRPIFLSLAVVALLLGLAVAPIAGGGRAGAQDQIELRIWDQFTGPETEAVDDIYAKFAEANPNIKIVRESFQTDDMRKTVNTALASGTGPDIIFYDAGPGYAGVLVNAGLLSPLEDFAAQYGWKEKIAGPSLEATSLNGQLYGLPLQVDLIGMYYNKTLLDQEGLTVPETVEQLKTFCGQAKEQGYTPIAFADLDGWPGFHQFSMTANAMIGPAAMRALLTQNQGNWNTPEIVTAITTYFVDLKEAGCFSEDANALTYDDGNDLFYMVSGTLLTVCSVFRPSFSLQIFCEMRKVSENPLPTPTPRSPLLTATPHPVTHPAREPVLSRNASSDAGLNSDIRYPPPTRASNACTFPVISPGTCQATRASGSVKAR